NRTLRGCHACHAARGGTGAGASRRRGGSRHASSTECGMSAIDVLARARARVGNRAVPIRERATFAPDPPTTFGIAAIRLVSEEHVQAIAYGSIDQTPAIVTRWHPLGRDSSDLAPFAAALDDYITDMLAAEILPRIWVP